MLNKAGFILLELLLAIILIQVGVLGCSQLLIDSLAVQINLERSLEALQLLRGEMEKLKTLPSPGPISHSFQEIKPGYRYALEVHKVTVYGVFRWSYKIVIGRITWNEVGQGERSYRLLTYIN